MSADRPSFVFHPSCELFERRAAYVYLFFFLFVFFFVDWGRTGDSAYNINRKLVTTVVSTFTAHYIYQWNKYFADSPLQPPYLPSFDGRSVIYPTTRVLRDYMSWRQVDCESIE